jgi:hypothetical protein
LRSTPRERAHYRRLLISSVSEPPRPRADCVEGLNRLIFSERFMGCGCAVLSLRSPIGPQGLSEALDCAASNHDSEWNLSS